MGFYRNQTSCQQDDKGEEKKKTLPEIHEDNSTASALSFSFFCEALIVRKYAAADVS